MKVALCFSGKLGNWKSCTDSITQNIIHPLKPDIYLSTWNNEDYLEFNRYYKVKKFTVWPSDAYNYSVNKKDLPYQPSSGLLPMLFNMQSVYKLLPKKKKIYDLVIRLRPDIQVLEPIKRYELQDCIDNNHIRLPYFESNNIYNHEEELKKQFAFSFVNDQAALPSQVNDQIAVGSIESMKKYMNCLNEVEQAIKFLWNEGYPEYMIKVPESVLTICLKSKNCKYKKLTGLNNFGNIKTKLIR